MKVDRIQHLGSIMVLGLLVGLCSWVIEAAVHSFILREGPLSVHVFYPTLGEVWHRLAMAVCFVGLGAYAQSLLAGRQRAEDALRKSEDKFRTIFDAANDGILIADAVTRQFIDVNAAMCRMVGYTREEILKLGLNDLHPPEEIPFILSKFERAVSTDVDLFEDIPVMGKTGPSSMPTSAIRPSR